MSLRHPDRKSKKKVNHGNSIVNYTALLGYTSQAFTDPTLHQLVADPASPSASDPNSPDHHRAQWFKDFRRVLLDAKVTSHETTSMLAMLSSSIQNAQPLPPYLRAPPGAQLSHKLEMVDPEILGLRHIAEPGYAAFAVMAVSTRCINMELERLLKAVKGLVGELDFSFHIVSTKEDGDTASSETLVQRSSRKMD